MTLFLLSLACTDSANEDSACTLNTYYLDADGDGFGDDATAFEACEAPPSYIAVGGDCDDLSAGVHPDAQEVCGGVDEDCDGLVDSVDDSLDRSSHLDYYPDTDGDGYGDSSESGVRACEPPDGLVADNSDCEDGDAAVNPGASEVCDGLDNDCDALIDDADEDRVGTIDWYLDADLDGYGSGDAQPACEAPGADYVSRSGDCDDSNGAQRPGAEEICGDGVMNDCDGVLEEAQAACVWGGELSPYTGDVDVTLTQSNDDSLPRSMSQGDLNHDGVQDYVVGGWVGPSVDRARLVLGPVEEDGSMDDAVLLSGDASDFVGIGSSIGDVDGDGDDEVLIGAQGYGEGGAVFLLTGPISADLDLDVAASLTVLGDGVLGTAVGLLGDQSGDGVSELLLGDIQSSRAGRIYVVSGALSGEVAIDEVYSASITANSNDYSAQPNSLAENFDADGDGVVDLAMGVSYGDMEGNGDGYVSVWTGELSGDLYADDADLVVYNSEGEDYAALGQSVNAGFDWNGDGYDDMWIGAPRGAGAVGDGGEAFLVLGPITGDVDLAVDAEVSILGDEDALLGGSFDVADADGDGQLDVLVGSGYTLFSSSSASSTSSANEAWLFAGPMSGDVGESEARVSLWHSSYFGAEVAMTADQNGDGELELLVLHGDDDGGMFLFLSPEI